MKTIKIRKRKLNESNEILYNRIDVPYLISLLETLFAEEILAWYQYWIAIDFMNGQERNSIENEFEKHAQEELYDHAKKIKNRIAELGGDAEKLMAFDLKSIANCQYIPPQKPYSTLQLICDNIESEKCAIEHYTNLCDYVKDKDHTTYLMALDILKDEEEHLHDLEDFYKDIIGVANSSLKF